MAILLAWIICPLVFGICFILQTSYFLYKIIKSRQTDYSEKTTITTISMTESETTCCNGLALTTCNYKRTNRITLKIFITLYLVCLILDIIVTLLFYFVIYYYNITV